MIVVTEKCGQLGNRLICFAHLIAFCAEHSAAVINPGFHDFSKFFEGCAGSGIPSFGLAVPSRFQSLAGRFPELAFKAINRFTRLSKRVSAARRIVHIISTEGDTPEFDLDLVTDPRSNCLMGTKLCLLQGWRYRSYELFAKHQSKIREYFTPVSSVREIVDSVISPLRQRADVIVGVHLRQGDYRDYLDGRYFLETAQYAHLMQSVNEQLYPKSVAFLLCSNEPQAKSKFGKLHCEMAPGTPIADMYSLAVCDYILAPPSTFSRWASFYGQVPLHTVEKSKLSVDVSRFSPANH